MQLLTDYGNSLNDELTKWMESYQSIGLLMGIAGLILGTLGSAVIGLSIYTAWQIAYGYEGYGSQESKLDTYQECMHYLTMWDKMIITMGLMIGLVGALIAGLIMWMRK
jgi:hypothetical protein